MRRRSRCLEAPEQVFWKQSGCVSLQPEGYFRDAPHRTLVLLGRPLAEFARRINSDFDRSAGCSLDIIGELLEYRFVQHVVWWHEGREFELLLGLSKRGAGTGPIQIGSDRQLQEAASVHDFLPFLVLLLVSWP